MVTFLDASRRDGEMNGLSSPDGNVFKTCLPPASSHSSILNLQNPIQYHITKHQAGSTTLAIYSQQQHTNTMDGPLWTGFLCLVCVREKEVGVVEDLGEYSEIM